MYNCYGGGGNPTSRARPSPGTNNKGNGVGYWYQGYVNPSSFSHTTAHSYDALNRLATAVATPFGSGSVSYNCATQCSAPMLSLSVNTDNQITNSGFTYDAAGDLTSDGSGTGTSSYTWDAERRVATATPYSGAVTTFTYNALGQRMRAASSNFTYDYAFGASGVAVGLFNAGGGVWSNYRVDVAGRQMLLFPSTSRWLYHPSLLGSTSMVTDQGGAVALDTTFYPWGQGWQTVGSVAYWKFASFDPTQPGTGLYPAPFRHYTSIQGRWLSPDPLAGSVYNPQSQNRYTYALDNPCSLVDPLGLSTCTLNIALINEAGVNPNYVAQAEKRIDDMLAASPDENGNTVQINFVSNADDVDDTLTLTHEGWLMSLFYPVASGAASHLISPRVYVENLATNGQPGTYAAAIGSVGLHELLHRPGSLTDVSFDPQNQDIMMYDDAPGDVQNGGMNNPDAALWKVTPQQVGSLWDKCRKLHSAEACSSGGPCGGSGSGGPVGAKPSMSATLSVCTTEVWWNGEQLVQPHTECNVIASY